MDSQPVDVDAIVRTLLLVRSVQKHPSKEGERSRTGALLLPMVTDLQALGLPFGACADGPWWVGCDHLESPHRHGDRVIPTITRGGHYRLRLDDVQTAAQLAGYLSWRKVPEPRELWKVQALARDGKDEVPQDRLGLRESDYPVP